MSLSKQHRALVVRDVNIEPKVEDVPVPECFPGTVILEVLASPVMSYTKDIFLGNSRKYTYPLPIVPGTSAICRVAALPPDSVSPSIQPGTLVLFDCTIRARSNDKSGPIIFLSAIHDGYTPASKALMANGGYKDGSYAEFMRAPLENIFALNESRLLNASTGFNYHINDLSHITRFLVPYGGLRSINLTPGESILIGPATGSFGSTAVLLALALGAKVVAWARNASKLAEIKSKLVTLQAGRYKNMLETVCLADDVEKDTATILDANAGSKFDAAFDISPPRAAGSSYIKSQILSLRHGGRISLMGGIAADVAIPHSYVMHFDITIKGKWMYSRDDVLAFIALVENGVVRLDRDGACEIVGAFGLDQWRQSWEMAWERNRVGEMVVLMPGK